jgi:hypothetical protein
MSQRPSELQLGREIAFEVNDHVRRLGCKTCGIGAAIRQIEERHDIWPLFDWAGAAAKKAQHACRYTTWDKRPVPSIGQERERDAGVVG